MTFHTGVNDTSSSVLDNKQYFKAQDFLILVYVDHMHKIFTYSRY